MWDTRYSGSVHEQPTLLRRGRKVAFVAAPLANQISSARWSLKLLLMAFVWRRGGLDSVRLLVSNKQKVTSLKKLIISPPDWLCGNYGGMKYVGCLTGAYWVAFEGGRWWFITFWAGSGGNLAFRSLKWRCWADSCVIMLLPTRVGEKKSQVNASGEAACRHHSPETPHGPWNRWKTDCGWAFRAETCLRGRRESGHFTSLGSALLARYSCAFSI